MAAQPLVRESYKNPRETYEINVMGTVNLLDAARQVGNVKAILNVTTDKCYENKEWLWGYRENEAMGGYDPYSSSKGCSELVTAAYRNSFFNSANYKEHGVALATARAGNVIGGGDWAENRLIPDFMNAVHKGERIKIRNPQAIRPWQHVLEPLTGYLMLAEKLYSEGTLYAEGWNFGPFEKDAKSVEWVINNLCTKWGGGVTYEIDSSLQPHEANYLKLDCSKARTMLHWQPQWSLERSLDSIIEWYKVFTNGGNIEKICYKQINDFLNEINT
jgi:CDP-glucose 4,6-dehydratase